MAPICMPAMLVVWTHVPDFSGIYMFGGVLENCGLLGRPLHVRQWRATLCFGSALGRTIGKQVSERTPDCVHRVRQYAVKWGQVMVCDHWHLSTTSPFVFLGMQQNLAIPVES